jgi:hypothetical protein
MFSLLSKDIVSLIFQYLPLNYISKELRARHLKKLKKQRNEIANLRYMMDSCLLGYTAIMIREFQKCREKKRAVPIPIIYRQQCIGIAKSTGERCKKITRSGYYCNHHKKSELVLHQTFHY